MTPVSGGGRLDSVVDTLWLIIPFLVSVLPSQRDSEPFAIRGGGDETDSKIMPASALSNDKRWEDRGAFDVGRRQFL